MRSLVLAFPRLVRGPEFRNGESVPELRQAGAKSGAKSRTEEDKVRLSAQIGLYNPVELRHNVSKTVDGLPAIHMAKVTFSK